MGNTVSSSKGESSLATVAVSKSMSLNRAQVLRLRDEAYRLTSDRSRIQRGYFHVALSRANIKAELDVEILDLLYTMWDIMGDNRVPVLEFVVGICPLACPGESLPSILLFAMQVMDEKETGMISSYETVTLLKSINATAAYFGDAVLSLRQIYKTVDNVFDTITLISQESDDLSHAACIRLLKNEPLIQKIVACKKQKPKVSFSPASVDPPFVKTRLEDESLLSADMSSVVLAPLVNTARLDEQPSYSTDVSSIVLTPLARLDVNDDGSPLGRPCF